MPGNWKENCSFLIFWIYIYCVHFIFIRLNKLGNFTSFRVQMDKFSFNSCSKFSKLLLTIEIIVFLSIFFDRFFFCDLPQQTNNRKMVRATKNSMLETFYRFLMHSSIWKDGREHEKHIIHTHLLVIASAVLDDRIEVENNFVRKTRNTSTGTEVCIRKKE